MSKETGDGQEEFILGVRKEKIQGVMEKAKKLFHEDIKKKRKKAKLSLITLLGMVHNGEFSKTELNRQREKYLDRVEELNKARAGSDFAFQCFASSK